MHTARAQGCKSQWLCDKHNCPQRDSIPGPGALQSDMLPLDHCDLQVVTSVPVIRYSVGKHLHVSDDEGEQTAVLLLESERLVMTRRSAEAQPAARYGSAARIHASQRRPAHCRPPGLGHWTTQVETGTDSIQRDTAASRSADLADQRCAASDARRLVWS